MSTTAVHPMNIQPAYTALLVIDMQRDFCSPGGYAETAGFDILHLRRPIPNILRLIDAARTAGMLVIYTREGHRPDLSDCPPAKMARSRVAGAPIGSSGPLGRLLIRGEYGHGIVDELAPQKGEPVVDKPGYGAFHQTDLEAILRARDIRHLILTGVTTEVCVQSTLREATDRGYLCTTVNDACASPSPELHRASMITIRAEGGIFGTVANTDDVLASFLPSSAGTAKP